MKKALTTLIALICTFFSLSLISNASTLDSINIFLKYESLEQAALTEQLPPTSITDAGEETINTLTGSVSYYSEEINLPGKNGFDLVIGRKFNADSDTDLYGNSSFVSVSGYRQSDFEDVPLSDGVRYVFPYYLTPDYEGEPIFIAYESIGDMLIAENNTASIGIIENYMQVRRDLTENNDLYRWGIVREYDIGFSIYSDVIFFDESLLDTHTTLYRKTSAGYNELNATVDYAYRYEEGTYNVTPSSLGCNWDYTIPKIIAWDTGYDEAAVTDCQYGMFYDPDTKMNVNIRFRYDSEYDALLDACCNTNFGFYEVEYDENDFYCINAEYDGIDFTYYIRRYDGVKFHFINDKLQYTEDRFGNTIEYSYSDDGKITIIDTLGREIVLSQNGISVNDIDVVVYSFSVDNNDVEDPDDIFQQDDTGFFKASYRTAGNTYKHVTYNIFQLPKVYYSHKENYSFSHSVAFSKSVINDITISTGAKRHYVYDDVIRYTYTYVEDSELDENGDIISYPAYHAIRSQGCVERYDIQPDSSTLENYQTYSYGGSKSKPSTITTFPAREGYTITDTYNLSGNLTDRVTECTDLEYTLTEKYSYKLTNRIYLVESKTVTKEGYDGSSLSFNERYYYSQMNNKPTKIYRDNTMVYEATYSDYGLVETEYSIYGTDEYHGVNNTITNGNVTQSVFVSKTSRYADLVERETSTYTYDSYGNITSIDGEGVYVEYSYEYGDYSSGSSPAYSIIITETYPEVANITDSQGVDIPSANVNKTSYYDKWGNLVKTVDGEGNITIYTYDYLGRLLTQKNPDNTTLKYQYNDTTNRITITNELGKRFNLRYDSLGREFAQYYLSEDGTMWKLLYHNNYDTYGNLTRHTVYYGGGVDCIYNYSYYTDNSLKTEILKQGLNVSVISQNSYSYTIPEDDLFAIAITRKKTDTENVTITNYTNQYGYKVKDIISDEADEIEQVYTTDIIGNIKTVKDPRGYTAHTYTYDYRGRVSKDTRPEGSTTNVYDGAYLYQVKDSYSHIIKTYEYNTQGQLIREITPIDDDTDNITEYYYDRNGNLTKTVTTTGDGTTTKTVSTRYDNRNRPIAVNDGSGYFTRYEYNNIGNITRMATGVPTATEALNRDTHSVTDYEYSYLDFLSIATDPMGYTESYTYNIQGTMLTSTDKNGTLFEYTYNGAPWLLSKTATGTNGTTQSVSYQYDYLGNITQMVDENGTTLYTYDMLGNTLTETRDGLIKEYTYDANGNRASANIADDTFNHNLTYTYDSNNRLTKVTDENGYTKYSYDKNNRLLTKKTYNPNGVVYAYENLEYYDSGLLDTKKNYRHSKTTTTYLIDDYSLTYFADGNIASVDNSGVVTSYVYDAAGRLTSESIDGTVKASYTYDARGNRATMTEFEGVTTYTYDKNNRLTAENTALNDGTTSFNYYCYNNSGTLQEKYWGIGFANYYYDLLGQLTRYSSGGNATTYTYDGNGLRTSKTVGNTTTNFINDGAYVVGEVSGDSIIKYTYGTGLISINNNGTVGYYHTDEHGNVSAISDIKRNVVADYDFDAFGNETVSTDAYYNPMRYCGEYLDAETGLIYLRARYYDPSIGRFIGEDPIKDGTNWYVYCSNNPIAFVDPSGLFGIDDIVEGLKGFSRFYIDKKVENPIFVYATQQGWLPKTFEFFGFPRENDVYHTRQDAIQRFFGYNSAYDVIFDWGTNMKATYFNFATQDKEYIIWAWKGDYLNLGAGSELGIYTDPIYINSSNPDPMKAQWRVDTNLAMPMTMSLYSGENLIFRYAPSEEQWWIAGFNPNFPDIDVDSLTAIYTIDFSDCTDIYNALKSQYLGQTGWVFDDDNYIALYSF